MLSEFQKHLLEVGEAYILLDVEALHLMEEAVCACRDGFVAVYSAGAYDADRGLCMLHGAGLHAGGVGAEQDVVLSVALYEEGVLHVACRMVGGEVQRAEYVPVVFYLRTFGDCESHVAEDVDDLVFHERERVASAEGEGSGRTGKVDIGLLFVGVVGESLLEGRELFGRGGLEFVEFLAQFALLLCGYGTEIVHQRGDGAFLTEVFDAELLHGFGRRGLKRGDFCLKLFYFGNHDVCDDMLLFQTAKIQKNLHISKSKKKLSVRCGNLFVPFVCCFFYLLFKLTIKL